MTIMTYDYEVAGTSKELILTATRSFKYDRKLLQYNQKNSAKASMRERTKRGNVCVADVMEAISKQKPLD